MEPEVFKRISFKMNLLGKRIIPCYFYENNPSLFTKWQYNSCRQTAITTNFIFQQLLRDYKVTDKYTVESFDGNFSDPFFGEYNHAWVYCTHESDCNKNILIDVARVGGNIGCIITPFNTPTMFLEDTIELNRAKLEDELIFENEYYTSKPGYEVLKEILKLLNKSV